MFCPNCGANAGDSKFCPGCGTPLTAQSMPVVNNSSHEEVVLWEGKPSGIVDKAKGALNATSYKLTNQRIIISGGIIGKSESEIDLRRIKDIKLTQSIADRIAKTGDLTIVSSDALDGTFILSNIANPAEVKEMIRNAVNGAKQNMGVSFRENF